jgi:alkylhydroperoxidase/carboxymuconolactone decarboxylase family protein YurZ
MPEDTPLIDTLAEMTAASVARANLSPEVLMLVRLAALAAVDAPESSYVLNIAAAADTELTLEDAQSVLVAVAPIIGGPKSMSAAQNITAALGLMIATAVQAEVEAEAQAGAAADET